MYNNLILETVEAEITAMMPLQRTCGAESQVRNKLSNGPLRVQSNGKNPKVFCNVLAYVSCRGYVGILLSARVIPWIKVAPRIVSYCKCTYSSLTECIFLSRAFLFYTKAPLTWDISQRSFSCIKEVNIMMTKRWWRSLRRIYEIKQKEIINPKPT